MSFSISDGLKRIVNVLYCAWLILGVIFFFFILINSGEIFFAFIVGILIPTVLRIILFYIIDGFFK